MPLGWVFLSGLPIKVFAIGAAGHGIVVPEEASLAQLREEELADIFEGLWEESVPLVAWCQYICMLGKRSRRRKRISRRRRERRGEWET